MSVLKILNLRFQYNTNKVLIDNLSFTLDKRQTLLIQGTSGSGKSTLIYLIAGCLRPTAGQIWLFNKNINRFSIDSLSRMRRKIGLITQINTLLKDTNVIENIMMPMLINNLSYDQAKKRADILLNEVGLSHKMYSSVLELSGGEEQRVLTARALSNNPEIILADEATANLDTANADKVLTMCIELAYERRIPMIWTTHQNQHVHLFNQYIRLGETRLKNV